MHFLCFSLIFFLFLPAPCLAQVWPEIAPVSGEVTFQDPENAVLAVTITDRQQNPLYSLTCQSGGAPEDRSFYYSGLFHCRLVALHPDAYVYTYVSSLLAEEMPQTADWEGRSRFLLNDVVGQCANTPDWGAERTFLLRRMRIQVGLRNVHLVGNTQGFVVAPYSVTYSVVPEANAETSIARASSVPEPAWFNRPANTEIPNAPWWVNPAGSCLREVLEKQ